MTSKHLIKYLKTSKSLGISVLSTFNIQVIMQLLYINSPFFDYFMIFVNIYFKGFNRQTDRQTGRQTDRQNNRHRQTD